jgi:hypothetical protein
MGNGRIGVGVLGLEWNEGMEKGTKQIYSELYMGFLTLAFDWR